VASSVGRNVPCPCGSGKKYKRCCGEPRLSTPLAGAFYNREENTIVTMTADAVINQIRRDTPRIAESFDRFYDTEFRFISTELSRVFVLLSAGLTQIPDPASPRNAACRVLSTASQTVVAALDLVRDAFPLQASILLRTAIEAIAMGVAINTDTRCHEQFRVGRLQSTKCIGPADRALPIIGRLYGTFSEQFAHLGPLHYRLDGMKELQERTEETTGVIDMIKSIVILLDMASELVLFELVEKPRYWESPERGKLRFMPSPEDAERFMAFVRRAPMSDPDPMRNRK
jgi:hypothetical protein